jgi:predicted glycosyltransferase
MARSARRVLFYSHNGVGVGHLQRQLDLAVGYRSRHPDSAVLVATGSPGVSMFAFPAGIDFLKLPSLVMVDRYRTWKPRDLAVPTETVVAMRAELLHSTVATFAPDLLIADFMPAGVDGELLPALDELARRGGAAIAGFRDVVDDPAFVRTLWDETGVYDVLRRHYVTVSVYGDPLMLDFAAYGLSTGLPPVRYCGYLGREPEAWRGGPRGTPPLILAMSGGGVDGSFVLERFCEAAGRLRPQIGGTWIAVTGPLMSARDHARVEALAELTGVEVRRVVTRLRSLVAEADCVVAMAGYNSVCDILSFRRPAVLVPRNGPSMEQTIRAAKLDEWGAARVVAKCDLAPDRLASEIGTALAQGAAPPAPIRLDGVANAIEILDGATAQVHVA